MRPWLGFVGAAILGMSLAGIGMASEPPKSKPSPDQGRLDVGLSRSQDGGAISSQKDNDGKKVLHGVQVALGPKNWMKEFSVYNNGVLEQRTQFYPNGRRFRFQRREHNGDGYEVVYSPNADKVLLEGKAFVQEELTQGTVKGDKRWEGTFLVWEQVPMRFETRLAIHEYHKGEMVRSTPFAATKLGLPADVKMHEGWMWSTPDWPSTRSR